MKNRVLVLLIFSLLSSCEQTQENGNSSQEARLSGLIYVWSFDQTSNDVVSPHDMIFAVLESGDAIWHHLGTRRFVKKTLPESEVEVLLRTLMDMDGSYTESTQMKAYLPEAFSEGPIAGLTCFVDGAPTRNYSQEQVSPASKEMLRDFVTRNFTNAETGLTRQR